MWNLVLLALQPKVQNYIRILKTEVQEISGHKETKLNISTIGKFVFFRVN